MKKYLLSIVLLLTAIASFAGTIKGTINAENGDILPYASIVVEKSNNGTFSNENGEFELRLDPGTYNISFRYVGFKTLSKAFTVGDETVFEKIVLTPEVITLSEVTVGKGEDPALTIMRKTIAMSTIHHLELETYSYKAYTKGNLKVIDVPFLLKEEMEKQFMKVGQLYVFESIVQFDYKQPNQLSQKTLAKKDNLPPNIKNAFNLNLGAFEFYDPDNLYSPVTPKGSRNYKYEYLGFFEENTKVINKIKVIPKNNSYGLFSGVLNIVDGSWYVHSYDFSSKGKGGPIKSKVIFRDQNGIWAPANFETSININVLGIEAYIKAIASIRDFKYSLNPRFAKAKPEVFDEKMFDAPPINAPNAIGLKDLSDLKKKLLKAEKSKNKSKVDADFDNVAVYTKDSLFDQKDSLFWEIERLVPLTNYEIEGFKMADSIILANRAKIDEKITKDSTETANRNKFKIAHLFSGYSYKFKTIEDTLNNTPKYVFRLGTMVENLRFNAVEGFGVGLGQMSFRRNYKPTSSIEFGTRNYYSFGQNRLFGNLFFLKSSEIIEIRAKVGSEVLQVNQQNPIANLLNSFDALLANENRAKFFQKDYFEIGFTAFPFNKLQIGSDLEFAIRSALENQIVKSPLRPRSETNYEPNIIENRNGIPFPTNELIIWSSNLSFYPYLNKNKVNGKIQTDGRYKGFIGLSHKFGFGQNGFGLLELSAERNSLFGAIEWQSRANAGFFYKKPNYFVDFKHFNGNELIANSHGDFRNLSYYNYSTNDSYFQLFNTILPQKLLVTQVPFVKKAGITEYLFHNYLGTSLIQHNELGYGWQFLQGAIHIEVLRAWNKDNSPSFAFRIWSKVN